MSSPHSKLLAERDSWDARCHFCGGPSYPWMTDDMTWAKVAPLLDQSQACFECFGAAWTLLSCNNGEPLYVSEKGPKTNYEVVQIILTGPPRWGEKEVWIVQDGPDAHYRQVAGPFTSRRAALDALTELVNEAYDYSPKPSVSPAYVDERRAW